MFHYYRGKFYDIIINLKSSKSTIKNGFKTFMSKMFTKQLT